MKKRLIFPLLFITTLLGAEDFLGVNVNAQVMVKDQRQKGNLFIQRTMDLGGYFVNKSDDHLVLRIPREKLPQFKQVLEEHSEAFLRWDQSSRDLRQTIQQNRASLEASQEILEKNKTYLDNSDVEGTLSLEREIRRLMDRIDYNKGQLRRLENDRKMARIDLGLSFQSNSLPDYRPSPFPWINQVDLFALLQEDFLSDQTGWFGPTMELPSGFALVDNKPEFKGLSPQGVRLRLKRVKNYPRQSLDFWVEALENHLKSRGYLPLSPDKAPSFIEDQGFSSTLWGVPAGEQDMIYALGLRLSGSKIEILEVGGLAENVLEL